MKSKILVCLLYSFAVQASDIFLDIQYRDYKAIARWWKGNPDVQVVNEQGQTLLIKAVQSGNRALVRRLLKNKVEINHIDDLSKTALDYAAEYGHKKLVLDLVKRKAMVTTQENLAAVKQVVTSRYRFFKAISSVFTIVTLISLGFAGLCIIQGCALGCVQHGYLFAYLGGGSALISTLLSAPFETAAIGWKDRAAWYNPNFMTTNNAIIR